MLHFFAEYLWVWLLIISIGLSWLLHASQQEVAMTDEEAWKFEMEYPSLWKGAAAIVVLLGAGLLIVATILGLIGKIIAAF